MVRPDPILLGEGYYPPIVNPYRSDTDFAFEQPWEIFGISYNTFYQVGQVFGNFHDYHKRNAKEQKMTIYEADDRYWQFLWYESHHVEYGSGSGLLSFGKKRKEWKEKREDFQKYQKGYYDEAVQSLSNLLRSIDEFEKILATFSNESTNKGFEKKYNQIYKDYKNANKDLAKLSKKSYDQKNITKYSELKEKLGEIKHESEYMRKVEQRKKQLDLDLRDKISNTSSSFYAKYMSIKKELDELFDKNFFPKFFANPDKKFTKFEEIHSTFYALCGKEQAQKDASNFKD